jgi:hypothetical protein
MDNCYCEGNGKGGVLIKGFSNVEVNGLTTRNQKNPFTIINTRKAYLQNFDFR